VPELRFTAATSSSIPDMQEPESQPFPMEHANNIPSIIGAPPPPLSGKYLSIS
jgi:hypothetical protein